MARLSNAQHVLLCELIAGQVIVEEADGGKIRYFTATINNNAFACYHRPRYVRNIETVFALLENGLIQEFVLWPNQEPKGYAKTKGYKASEKAMSITAACTSHGRKRKGGE